MGVNRRIGARKDQSVRPSSAYKRKGVGGGCVMAEGIKCEVKIKNPKQDRDRSMTTSLSSEKEAGPQG